jgi:hypothetical protein
MKALASAIHISTFKVKTTCSHTYTLKALASALHRSTFKVKTTDSHIHTVKAWHRHSSYQNLGYKPQAVTSKE